MRQQTTATMADTARAARASARDSTGRRTESGARPWARAVPANPAMTTAEDQMSVEKCRASASSAWLLCLRAMRRSMREREKSTATDTAMTAMPQTPACTGSGCRSRATPSCTIHTQVAARSRVSARAERFSTLPWP